MKVAPRLIPTAQHQARTKALMPELLETHLTKNQGQVVELFALHNDIFYPKITKTHCCRCRARVFKAMTNYYNSING